MTAIAPITTLPDDIRWQVCRLDGLSPLQLQYIYMARQRVFAVEQNCVYLDVDGADEWSYHLAAWTDSQREPLAYARIVDAGVKYAEPSIGRLITTHAARGVGLGRDVLRRAIAHARSTFPGQGIRISAQSRLERFYAGAGFRIIGESYIEDGIPHTEMLLDA